MLQRTLGNQFRVSMSKIDFCESELENKWPIHFISTDLVHRKTRRSYSDSYYRQVILKSVGLELTPMNRIVLLHKHLSFKIDRP